MVNRNPAYPLSEAREAVEVTLPISMHTDQIIMLTKMMSGTNLRFYDFEAGVPVETWRSRPSGSS